MAAQPSRPTPLGGSEQSPGSYAGATSPSSSELYYSNDDIKLLYHIVTAGETILSSMPEDMRFPANALFQAADQVLPSYGYHTDSVPNHLARFLFKINGLRAEGSLFDKFESLLGELGIELAFDESASRDDNSTHKSASPRSSAGDRDHSGLPLPIRLADGQRGSPPPDASDRVSLLGSSSRGLGHQVRTRSVSPLPHPRPLLNVLRTGRHGDDAHLRALDDAENAVAETTDCSPLCDFPPRNGPGARLGRFHENASQDEFTLHGMSGDELDPSKNILEDDEEDWRSRSSTEDFDPPSHCPEYPPSLDMTEKAELEAKSQALHNEDLDVGLDQWRNDAAEKEVEVAEDLDFADKCDHHESTYEACGCWAGEAFLSRNNRVGTNDYVRWIDRNERLASRTYELHAMHTAVGQLAADARDEVERTAVARRHVLRKRLYDGWEQQHIEDQEKIRDFPVDQGLGRWSSATLEDQVRKSVVDQERDARSARDTVNTISSEYKERLADYKYEHTVQEDTADTWYIRKQDVDTEKDVADFYETRMPALDAVNNWHERLDDITPDDSASQVGKHNVREDTEEFMLPESLEEGGGSKARMGPDDSWDLKVKSRVEPRTVKSLKGRLVDMSEQQEEHAARQSMGLMKSCAQDATAQDELLDQDSLVEPVNEWHGEAKLQVYTREQDWHDQAEAVETITLSNRAKIWKIATSDNDVEDALDIWHAATQGKHHKTRLGETNGDTVSTYYMRSDTVHHLQPIAKHAVTILTENAKTLDLYYNARPCAKRWRALSEQRVAARMHREEQADDDWAQTNTESAVSSWARGTKETRRKTLTGTYHEARRKGRQTQAVRSVSAMRENLQEQESCNSRAASIREDELFDMIDQGIEDWNGFTNNAQELEFNTLTAEQIQFIRQWLATTRAALQARDDALDYDQDERCTKAVVAMEHQKLGQEGPKHTVSKVQKRNDSRESQHIVDHWHQTVQPDAPVAHESTARSKIEARRSLRQSTRDFTPTPAPLSPRKPAPEKAASIRNFTPTPAPLSPRKPAPKLVAPKMPAPEVAYDKYDASLAPAPLSPRKSPQKSAPETADDKYDENEPLPKVDSVAVHHPIKSASVAAPPSQPAAPRSDDLGEELRFEAAPLSQSLLPDGIFTLRRPRPHLRASSSAYFSRSARRSASAAFRDFDDYDEPLDSTEIVASTPVRRSAMAPYRTTHTTTTPSAILPSPAERDLRRTYGERHVVFADIEEEDTQESGL